MKKTGHLLLYLVQFFLEWEMLQIKVVEKIKTTHFKSDNSFFPKTVPFMR